MSSPPQKSAEAIIEEGRRHYGDKRYKPALEQFTRAMKLCSCARGMKRERCSCKNFEKVAAEGASLFNEAMYNCTCSVGKTFNKCDKSLHIQALDYRAATFEALGELARAQRDAEWILELAPRLLEGYLRLGKIARLQKKYEFAWSVYSAGIDVGKTHGLAGSPKLKILYNLRQPLHQRFYRVDPLKNPPEIVQRIFHYVDFTGLVRCISVCKSWRRYLVGRGNERLWRSMAFSKNFAHRYAPSNDNLRKLMSYSGNDVRELYIDDVLRFRLNQSRLQVLSRGTKNLQRLVLGGTTEETIQIPESSPIFSKLTTLVLRDIVVNKSRLLKPLLANASECLESVHVTGLPQYGSRTGLEFPHMPKLKYLRLEEQSRPYPLRLEIFDVAAKTPSLEQIWLNDIQLGSTPLEEGQLDSFWKSLKGVVVIGSTDSDPETSENIRRLSSIRRGSSLQCIDFDFRWKYDEHGPLGVRFISNMFNQEPASISADERGQNNQYENMRSLRLSRAMIAPSKLQEAIGDAIIAGKLHTLDLVFPLEGMDSALGADSIAHLRRHEWLRGASSIRCLGVFEFRFCKYPKDDDELPLPSFLASFPNLETLEINSAHYEPNEFYSVLQAVLKVTKLRKLYQSVVQGTVLDHLREMASGLGVEVIWGERPRAWPMPVEE